jgi:hypothetical protein
MTTDTLISRIQLRRGNFEDLPILKEGELGYAMDRKRLFIGNPSQTIISTGDTDTYALTFRIARPSQIIVVVDNTQKTAGVHYTVSGTTLTFNAPAPALNAVIEVGVNNEIVLDKADAMTDTLPILAAVMDTFSGIYFDSTVYNTAVIDYSLKDSSGNMQVGQIRMITNGIDVSVADTSNAIGSPTVSFSGEIDGDDYFRLNYTNSSSSAGTFYYTIRLWYTQ